MEKRPATAFRTISMNAEDQARLTKLYNDRFAQYGVSVQTVGWGRAEDQLMRFAMLCRGLDLAGKRVLDLGCGLGDFVPWAEARYGVNFDYVGIDLVESLIKAATDRFGGPRRQFIPGTLGSESQPDMFDIVVSSGALSFRTTDNKATMRALLSEAWKRTRETLCVNFLSTYVDFELTKNFHYQPEEMFTFAKTLSPWVVIYHDYPLYEFTIQILRNPTGRKDPGTRT